MLPYFAAQASTHYFTCYLSVLGYYILLLRNRTYSWLKSVSFECKHFRLVKRLGIITHGLMRTCCSFSPSGINNFRYRSTTVMSQPVVSPRTRPSQTECEHDLCFLFSTFGEHKLLWSVSMCFGATTMSHCWIPGGKKQYWEGSFELSFLLRDEFKWRVWFSIVTLHSKSTVQCSSYRNRTSGESSCLGSGMKLMCAFWNRS